MTGDSVLDRLLDSETIAVVGCSTTPGKAAHDVPKYLLDHGYEVIPVNPFTEDVFGRTAYDSLTDVPDEIDLVDVFRPSDEVPEIVEELLDRDDVSGLWLQRGITHQEATQRARDAGIDVVEDSCIKVQHQRR